jgi:hypothetical protein
MAVLGLVLTSCSGSSHADPHAAQGTGFIKTTTPRPTPASSTSFGSVRPARSVATRCQPDQLHGTAHYVGGAAGNDRFDVIVRNSSTGPCTLDGYPGLGFLDAHRQPYTTIEVHRGGGMLVRDPKPHLVALAPGASASASISYTPSCNEGEKPAVVRYIEFTPPDDTNFVLVAVPSGDPQFWICAHNVSVSAVTQGSHGTPTH